METKNPVLLTPEQLEAYNKVKALLDTARESLKEASDLTDSIGSADLTILFVADLTALKPESSELDPTQGVFMANTTATEQKAVVVLAEIASDQETPWLLRAYKNARERAMENKTFQVARIIKSLDLPGKD